MRVTYVGHSTTLIELGGVRVLTDPLLRARVLHLERRVPPVRLPELARVQLVLISHLHPDHFDPRSLRMLERETVLVVPKGTGRAATRLRFANVIELAEGESVSAAGLELSATHAVHRRGRLPGGRSEAIGFTIAGEQRLYFAGDTDLFEGMRTLRPLDLALLPVWGWGPRLGPGHLDPERAAEALGLLEPRVAVPIHWGTIYRIGLRRLPSNEMKDPPHAFARAAARIAPAVEVRVLEPAESTVIEPASQPS